jgi:hypothetical protein
MPTQSICLECWLESIANGNLVESNERTTTTTLDQLILRPAAASTGLLELSRA